MATFVSGVGVRKPELEVRLLVEHLDGGPLRSTPPTRSGGPSPIRWQRRCGPADDGHKKCNRDRWPDGGWRGMAAGAFPLVGVAEDTRFELVRA